MYFGASFDRSMNKVSFVLEVYNSGLEVFEREETVANIIDPGPVTQASIRTGSRVFDKFTHVPDSL